MAQKRTRRAFIDSGPFVLDLAWPKDPRTPLSRRFLDVVRGTGRASTSPINVLEVAGAVSFNATPGETAALVRGFGQMYGIAITPPDPVLMLRIDQVSEYLARRMKLGDALTLWAAESARPAVHALVTWNARDFAGRTRLDVVTPQDFLRGR